MASKSKAKLKKKQFEVGGRIIDLQRFAYDIFVHSAKKFGVPEECIYSWEDEENDYLYSDFILVVSRSIFKAQIANRFGLHGFFMNRYKSTNFETFQAIQTLLQELFALSARTNKNEEKAILREMVRSLSVINELILFLYSQNCKLYLKEMARFWFQYWCRMKKNLEKAGGLAEIYKKDSKKKYDSYDVFFDKFIPKFCIPYESTCLRSLQDTYLQNCLKFFEDVVSNSSEKFRLRVANTEHKSEYVLAVIPSVQVNLPPKTSEQGERLDTSLLGADAATSHQNHPFASQQGTERVRKESSSRKEGQKKKPKSRSSKKDRERLNTSVLEADAATSPSNLPSTSRDGTENDHTEPSSQNKNSSSSLSVEGLEHFSTSLLGDYATTPQALPNTSGQEIEGDRRISSSGKKKKQKKSRSRSNLEDFQRLNLGSLPRKPSDKQEN